MNARAARTAGRYAGSILLDTVFPRLEGGGYGPRAAYGGDERPSPEGAAYAGVRGNASAATAASTSASRTCFAKRSAWRPMTRCIVFPMRRGSLGTSAASAAIGQPAPGCVQCCSLRYDAMIAASGASGCSSAEIGYGKIAARSIVERFVTDEQNEKGPAPEQPGVIQQAVRKIFPFSSSATIKVKGYDDLLTYLAKCCNPLPASRSSATSRAAKAWPSTARTVRT